MFFFCFRMSSENIAICSTCQMTFNSHDAVLNHTCLEIKQEKIEVDDIKDERGLSENDSDCSPKKKKKKRKIETISEMKQREREKQKEAGSEVKLKVETNELLDEKQNIPNLELSEQFIVFILKQVDELCENIQNGDPDTKRSREINQNLNNAVSSYRSILNFGNEMFGHSEYYDDIGVETNDYDTKYFFHQSMEENVEKPKLPKKKVKKPKEKEGKIRNGEKNKGGRPYLWRKHYLGHS